MKRVFVLCVIAAVILPQELYAKGFSSRSRISRSPSGASLFRSSMPPKVAPNLATPMRKAAPTAPTRPVNTQSTASGSSSSAPSSSSQTKEASGSSLKNAIAPALIGAGAGYVASSLVNSHADSNAEMVQSQSIRLAAQTIVQNAVPLESPVNLEGETCTKKALTRKGDVVYLNDRNEICGVFAVNTVASR